MLPLFPSAVRGAKRKACAAAFPCWGFPRLRAAAAAHRSCSSNGQQQQQQPPQRRDPRDAVVKIFNTRQRPGWTVPWQMQPVESSTGSGALIYHNGSAAILTAAHVVADTRYLQVQRSTDRFSSEKFRTQVAAVCHEIDLALLTLEDPRAVEDIVPLTVGSAEELPCVFDKVHVVGYPVGGDAVSVTEGVVSRVEVQEYSHSMRPGLALTVDAAINSGNSGGPLLDGSTGNVVGVAFQKLVARGVELQGHAVPAPMIQKFLREAAASETVPGETLNLRMPSLGWDFQSLEPPALRRALGVDSSRHGVLVNRLHYVDEPPEVRIGDVMLRFNGLELDDLGFCDLLGRRLHFAAARDLCSVGSQVPLMIWRDGLEVAIEHRLAPSRHFVPRGQYDTMPRYYICGGLVLQPLSHEYLMGWNVHERPSHLQTLFQRGQLLPERREAVMVAQILADEVNIGYDSGWVGAPIVTAVNGKAIRDLDHLISIVEDVRRSHTSFLEFDLEMANGPYRVVLATDALRDADERIKRMYGLPDLGSESRPS